MRHRPQILALAGALALAGITAPLIGPPAAAADRVIVVRPGQTLSEIAVRAGVSVGTLVRLNNLVDPNRIFAGQRLRIGAGAAHRPARRERITHRVSYGETLSGIALRYGTTVAALARANRIGNVSFIWVGQLLRIRRADDAERQGRQSRGSAQSWATHRVTYGETLWTISMRYGTTVTAIARANRIRDVGLIRAGQILHVPGHDRRVRAGSDWSAHRGGASSGAMPPAMAATVHARRQVGRLIAGEARRQGVPVSFALAVAWQESGWQPLVVSYAGAIGVMQLLPATGEWVGATMLGRAVNLWDPGQNARAGVRLLRHYLDRYGGNRAMALAAYYQGQTAADRYGIFPVSRPYIASILRLQQLFAG